MKLSKKRNIAIGFIVAIAILLCVIAVSSFFKQTNTGENSANVESASIDKPSSAISATEPNQNSQATHSTAFSYFKDVPNAAQTANNNQDAANIEEVQNNEDAQNSNHQNTTGWVGPDADDAETLALCSHSLFSNNNALASTNADTIYYKYDAENQTLYLAKTQKTGYTANSQTSESVPSWHNDTTYGNIALKMKNVIIEEEMHPDVVNSWFTPVTTTGKQEFPVLQSIKNLDYLKTNNVVSAKHMMTDVGFYNTCTLDFGERGTQDIVFDLSNINCADGMFNSTKIGGGNFQITNFGKNVATGNITANYMYQSSDVTSIDMSSWNLSRVNQLSYMFCNCASLNELTATNIEEGNSLVVQNLTTARSMFCDCVSLVNVDLRNWDATHPDSNNDFKSMFAFTQKLHKIYVQEGTDWSSANGNNMFNMYLDEGLKTSALEGCNGTTVTDKKSYDATFAKGDKAHTVVGWNTDGEPKYAPGYLTAITPKAVLKSDGSDGTLTFVNDDDDHSTETDVLYVFDIDAIPTSPASKADIPWHHSSLPAIKSVVTDDSMQSASIKNMDYWFAGLNVSSLDLSNLNTSDVVSCNHTFEGSTNLQNIFVGDGWDMSNVTSSTNMFNGCSSLRGGNGLKVLASAATADRAKINDVDAQEAEILGYLSYVGSDQISVIYNYPDGTTNTQYIKKGRYFTVQGSTADEGASIFADPEGESGYKFDGDWSTNQALPTAEYAKGTYREATVESGNLLNLYPVFILAKITITGAKNDSTNDDGSFLFWNNNSEEVNGIDVDPGTVATVDSKLPFKVDFTTNGNKVGSLVYQSNPANNSKSVFNSWSTNANRTINEASDGIFTEVSYKWQTPTSSTSLSTTANAIRLDKDVTISTPWTPAQNCHLDLNNHTLKYSSSTKGSVIKLQSGQVNHFNVYDSSLDKTGNITGGTGTSGTYSGKNVYLGAGIYATGNNGTTVDFWEGCIYQNGTSTGELSGGVVGGAVFVDSNVNFRMHGGAYEFNYAWYGGGVFLNNNATMTMTGGNLGLRTEDGKDKGNTAGGNGGGIFISSGARCDIVYSSDEARLMPSSYIVPTVSANKANNFKGGGIYNENILNINGGTDVSKYVHINNNSAGTYGGGICNNGSTSAENQNGEGTISHCDIFGNTATFGGGIHNGYKTTINDGSRIYQNNATKYGGGVAAYSTYAHSAKTDEGVVLGGGFIYINENKYNSGTGDARANLVVECNGSSIFLVRVTGKFTTNTSIALGIAKTDGSTLYYGRATSGFSTYNSGKLPTAFFVASASNQKIDTTSATERQLDAYLAAK